MGQVKIKYEEVFELFVCDLPKDTFQMQQKPSNKTLIDRFNRLLLKRLINLKLKEGASGI